jgi:heat shock protein HslJ
MTKPLTSQRWILIAVLVVAGLVVAACAVGAPAPEAPAAPPAAPAAPAAPGAETMTLYVGPNRVPCMGVAPMVCYQVRETPDGEYTLFYDQIAGFEYEPGYEYELLVQRETRENVPADASAYVWTLLEEISKTPVAATAELEGTLWQLIAMADAQGQLVLPIPGSEATATFQDGGVGGNASCNTYFGSYTVDGDSLTITMGGMTMMACPDPLMAQEQLFATNMQNAASYEITADQLHIRDAAGATILAFSPVLPTPLTGTTWLATSYNNGQQAVVSVLGGTAITAVFGEDGSLTGSAGCNNYMTGYQVDGNNMTIEMAATTRMMCVEPEGVMEQEAAYLLALTTTATFAIQGDSLELRTADGALVASFVVQPAPSAEAPVEPDMTADVEALKNMEYTGTSVFTDTVLLTNGVYTETVAPDVPMVALVQLIEPIAFGELNGQPAAAVILASSSGGTGVFVDLAAALQQDGQWMNVATTPLGDRVVINAVTIANNQIVVDMITHGPDDPMCCPTQQVVQAYELQDNALVPVEVAAPTAEMPAPTAPITPTAEANIFGVLWQWTGSTYGDDSTLIVDDPSRYTLTLQVDGTVQVQADCNRGAGTYTIDGSSLTFGPMAMTMMACPPDSLDGQYLQELGLVASYVTDGADLILNLMADGGSMRFSPAPAATEPAEGAAEGSEATPAEAPNILNTIWLWEGTTTPVEEITAANPENYRFALLPGGLVRAQADCNQARGTYTLDGNALTMQIGAMTRMACPPESQADLFLTQLNSAALYFVQDGKLFIDLFADGGTMRFAPRAASQ